MSLAKTILNENNIIIMNENTIAIDNKTNIVLFVDVDSKRNFGEEDAYFKCAPSLNLIKNNPARISFRSPTYIIHNKDSKQFILDRNQREALVKLVRLPYKRNPSMTVWQGLISVFNDSINTISKDNTKYILPLDLEIPDYLKLKESTWKK